MLKHPGLVIAVMLMIPGLMGLGCHPSIQVRIGQAPDEAHPILADCLTDGSACLEAFDQAAMLGLKKTAGQALILHAFYRAASIQPSWNPEQRPTDPEVVNLLRAGLSLNPSPWLSPETMTSRTWLEGSAAPLPDAPAFDVLSLDSSRPGDLSEGITYADLPVSMTSFSPSLQARLGAAFNAHVVVYTGPSGLVHTAPFVPMAEIMTGQRAPGGPGIQWSLAMVQAEQALRSDTPAIALKELEKAYSLLQSKDAQTARDFVTSCAQRISAFSLLQTPNWSNPPHESVDTASLDWLFTLPRRSKSPALNLVRLRSRFGEGWPERSDMTWALLERFNVEDKDNAVGFAPLRHSDCGRILSYLERLTAIPAAMDWSVATPVLLQVAHECGESARVAGLAGIGLTHCTGDSNRDDLLARNFMDFAIGILSTRETREHTRELGQLGFFDQLAESLESNLPQDRSQRIFPNAARALQNLLIMNREEERLSAPAKNDPMNVLREIALDRIPEDGPLWWKMTPAIYGGLAATGILMSKSPADRDMKWREFREHLPHWKQIWFSGVKQPKRQKLGARIIEFLEVALEVKERGDSSLKTNTQYEEARINLLNILASSFPGLLHETLTSFPTLSSGLAPAQPENEGNAPEISKVWFRTWLLHSSLPESLLFHARVSSEAQKELFPFLNDLPDSTDALPALFDGGSPPAQMVVPEKLSDALLMRELIRTIAAVELEKDASITERLVTTAVSIDGAPAGHMLARLSGGYGLSLGHTLASKGLLGGAMLALSPDAGFKEAMPLVIRCTTALDVTGHLVVRVEGTAAEILEHGMEKHAYLEWHSEPLENACTLSRENTGMVGNLVHHRALGALLALAKGERSEVSRRLLDLVQLLRETMHSPGLRASFATEAEPGILGWVGTLARLQGHLLLGTEIDNSGMTASLWRSTSMADELSSWNQLPKWVPAIVEFERIAPLVLSWVDIQDASGIGTLRAASQAMSYRSELVPTWSADLAVEVLRAALGNPKGARRNIRKIPASREPQVELLTRLWRNLFSEDSDAAELRVLRKGLEERKGTEDGLLAVFQAYRVKQVDNETLDWLKGHASSPTLHPLLKSEAAYAASLAMLNRADSAEKGLEYFERNVLNGIQLLNFDTAGDAYMSALPIALSTENFVLAGRLMRSAKEHMKQLGQGGDGFSVQIDVLLQAISLLTGHQNEANLSELQDRLKPFREQFATEWKWITAPITRESAHKYLRSFFAQ